MDLLTIINSLNDFTKVVESPYKNGTFALLTQEDNYKETIYYKKYTWTLQYKAHDETSPKVIKEFAYSVPLIKNKKEEITQIMAQNLLIFIYGFLLQNYK